MKSTTRKNLLLIALAVLIFAVALVMGARNGGEFGGTDSAATDVIAKSDKNYRPWFSPIWEQPGGEVESGLFALQAALGAGLLGFVLGTYRERRNRRWELESGTGVEDASGSTSPAHVGPTSAP